MQPHPIDSLFDDWAGAQVVLGGAEAIDKLAFATGAMQRRREVKTGSQLLHLAPGYAATGRSLRTTAAWAAAGAGVDVSDPALIGRLSNAGDFLAALVAKLLSTALPFVEPGEDWDGPPVRVVDGSVFCGPGRKGVQHRLHAAFDPLRNWFASFELTDRSGGENLTRTGVEKGEVVVGDRNYAKTWACREVAEAEAFFCVRAGACSMRMLDPRTGGRIGAAQILAAPGDGGSAEIAVVLAEAKGLEKPPLPARLVILRASEAAEKHERARIERSKIQHKAKPKSDTQALAGVVAIASNLPPGDWPAARVAQLHRLRWQIELAFKTLKSTFGMREVPSKTPEMARTWILANLAAALLAQRLAAISQDAIPPCAEENGQDAPNAARCLHAEVAGLLPVVGDPDHLGKREKTDPAT